MALLSLAALASHRACSSLLRSAPAALQSPRRFSRLFHATPSAAQAKAKAKPAAAAGPAVVEKYDLSTQIPVNLLKEGAEPTYAPDDAYPPWLWTLLDEPPLLEDLAMKGVEKLTQSELKRVIRLASKRRIKEKNDASAKVDVSAS